MSHTTSTDITRIGWLRLREEIVLRRFDVYRDNALSALTQDERDEYDKLKSWPERRNFLARMAAEDAIADADIIIAALYPDATAPAELQAGVGDLP